MRRKLVIVIEAVPKTDETGQIAAGHVSNLAAFWGTDTGERLDAPVSASEVLAVLEQSKAGLYAQIQLSPPSILAAPGKPH